MVNVCSVLQSLFHHLPVLQLLNFLEKELVSSIIQKLPITQIKATPPRSFCLQVVPDHIYLLCRPEVLKIGLRPEG